MTELYVTEALDRVDADEAAPGEIVAVAGLPEVTIQTLADPEDPRLLTVVAVDEPSLSMTIGINSSPSAGQDGAEPDRADGEQRLIRARRQRLAPRRADRAADIWEVQGLGHASARGSSS